MLVDLSPDQEFFAKTTGQFLTDQVPAAALRRFGGTVPADFEAGYWRRGAELGWTSLLVSEEAGGGSISGDGLTDLALIAYEFGRRAAPGPLAAASVAAAALGASGTHPDALAEVLAGQALATWCHAGPPGAALTVRADGADLILDGVKRPAEAAARAKYLLVTGDLDGEAVQVLVPSGTPGVTVSPLRTPDFSRDFAQVTFDGTRVPASALVGPPEQEPGPELAPGGTAAQVEWQCQVALVLASAESAGAMRTGLDLTLAWVSDRYSFGRPLASYQALKHRLADMASWLEAACAVTAEAARAVGERTPEAAELASAAKAFTGRYGTEMLQECVQLHGGIGLTREHDLHLYLRRTALNRALHGTPGEHRRRIADHVINQEGL